MIRFFFKCTLLTLLLVIVPVLLIRAKPIDDRDMQAVLTAEDCPMPCFMGILPGVTTVEEALAILEASGLVENIDDNRLSGLLYWKWKGQPPTGLGEFEQPYMSYNWDKVSIINLPSQFQFGDFFIRTAEFFSMWPATSGLYQTSEDIHMVLMFQRPEFSLLITISCNDLWHSPVSVMLTRNPPLSPVVYSTDNGLSVVNSIYHVCGRQGSSRVLSEQP